MKPFHLTERFHNHESVAIVVTPGVVGLVLLFNPTVILGQFDLIGRYETNLMRLKRKMRLTRLVGAVLVAACLLMIIFLSD